jgi:hypothetical protein
MGTPNVQEHNVPASSQPNLTPGTLCVFKCSQLLYRDKTHSHYNNTCHSDAEAALPFLTPRSMKRVQEHAPLSIMKKRGLIQFLHCL